MEFDLEKYNQSIQVFAEYLKNEFDTVYNAYERQSEQEICKILMEANKDFDKLSTEVLDKIKKFVVLFVSLSKSKSFFLRGVDVKDNSVTFTVITKIFDLTYEDHRLFLKIMSLCDDTEIDVGVGESMDILMYFTIKGE